MTSRSSLSKLAETIVREAGFTQPPICPVKIARKHEIQIAAVPRIVSSAAGVMLRHHGQFGILYADSRSAGSQRFTVAHELGHYFIEGHCWTPAPGKKLSHAETTEARKREREAEYFASCLLMPRKMVQASLRQSTKSGFAAVEELAKGYQTSLTAAAFRYAELTKDTVGVALVGEGSAIAAKFSAAFVRSAGLADQPWLKGRPMPQAEAIRQAIGGGSVERRINLSDWLPGAAPIQLVEEIKGLGTTGRLLIVHRICTDGEGPVPISAVIRP